MEEGLELGNQIGEAYVKRDLINDLNVMSMVSFCWPQLVPAKAFRRFRRGEARVIMEEI